MRAHIERDTATGTDGWGGAATPSMTSIGDPVPCFVYSQSRRAGTGEVTDGVKNALIDELRAMFPLDADVRARDEIVRVVDRRDQTLIDGRLRISAKPERRHNHLEASLERIT